MFSQLCRACLIYLSPGESVSLFSVEHSQNIFYYHMCSALQLSVEEDDDLPGNVCKNCADEILKFYKFHLRFYSSDRELRHMLSQSTRSTDESFLDETKQHIHLTEADVKECHQRISTLEEHDSVDHKNAGLLDPIEVNTADDYVAKIDVDENWVYKTPFECIKVEPITDDIESNYIESSEFGRFVEPDDTKFSVSLVDDTGIFGNQSQCEPNGRWKCKKCSKCFQTRDLLREHNRLHEKTIQESTDRRRQCPVCSIVFPTRIECANHRRNEHRYARKVIKDIECVCAICDKIFASKRKIRKHMHAHIASNSRLCNICGLTFSSISNLNAHTLAYHNREKIFHCIVCDVQLSSKDSLEGHMNRHRDVKPFPCQDCDKQFYGRLSLSKHRRTYHRKYEIKQNVDPDVVVQENKTLFDVPLSNEPNLEHADLLNPIESTNVSPQRKCPVCSIVFPTRKACADHRRNKHPYARKVAKDVECVCAICDKIFPSKRKIRNHMDTHKPREPQLCNICGATFNSFGLNAHIRLYHDLEKNFSCTICDSKFNAKDRLEAHLNRHKGIRKYECKLCDKKFYAKPSLTAHHQSIHLHFKKFGCEICPKKFNRNYDLKLHLRTVHRQL